ncbi:MAG: protein YgfX [Pseudomonadota bacterium]
MQLVPKRSRCYASVIVIVHTAALVGALANGLSPALKFALAAAVLSSGGWTLWRHVYAISSKEIRLTYSEFAGWRLNLDSTGDMPATLLPSSIVTTWLCMLHFRAEEGAFHSVILFRDALEPEVFRRLRVVLKSTSPVA